MADILIRTADPDRDAAAVAEIYRPAVERGIASFEEAAPDASSMRARILATHPALPWLVAAHAAEPHAVVGYAYAGRHRERAGYRWSVDISVYVAEASHGRGVGRALYDVLLDVLRRQGIVNAFAGIALPNPASVALHRAIGMTLVGVYPRVGFKHGSWHDVAWYGMRLAEPGSPPPEPISLLELGPPTP
jgi:L-amino acid N-acyltransferase YncA